MLALNRILVALDFSPASEAALRRALDLALRTKAEVHVLHAVPGPHPAPRERGVLPHERGRPRSGFPGLQALRARGRSGLPRVGRARGRGRARHAADRRGRRGPRRGRGTRAAHGCTARTPCTQWSMWERLGCIRMFGSSPQRYTASRSSTAYRNCISIACISFFHDALTAYLYCIPDAY